MNPLSFIAAPVTDITRAITFPFKIVFVVGICAFINYLTSPGHWWVQWVAFGMGIALLCIWARALKTAICAGILAGIGILAYRWWQRRAQRQDSSTEAANSHSLRPR